MLVVSCMFSSVSLFVFAWDVWVPFVALGGALGFFFGKGWVFGVFSFFPGPFVLFFAGVRPWRMVSLFLLGCLVCYDQKPYRETDQATWKAMIVGYTQNGLVEEAFITFRRMFERNVTPNVVNIALCSLLVIQWEI
ncbi:hypothetical protein Pint_32820 [Pistacia integerrima]|uniref:Uncharacterized protein n=1 Tax=Pistacia integerrima TaxID=434235 RepID=A0ACC0X5L1_9ROSI|nr:hypothetical protein Pint_32820 [Pistacia integerrima]